MKLVISDLDGTLLMRGDAVHDDDLRAARAFQAHGIHVSIATGRLYSGTRATCRLLGIQGPVACADGSQLVDSTDDRLLALHALSPQCVDWLLQVDATGFALADDHVHHDARGTEYLKYLSAWTQQVKEHSDLREVSRLKVEGVTKIVVLIGAQEPLEAALDRANQEGHSALFFPFRGTFGLLVRQGGIDKGTGVSFIAQKHGVELQDVAVVGDWLNDVPMLMKAGHRFAMAHASEGVKMHAQHVLPTQGLPGRPLALIAQHFGIAI